MESERNGDSAGAAVIFRGAVGSRRISAFYRWRERRDRLWNGCHACRDSSGGSAGKHAPWRKMAWYEGNDGCGGGRWWKAAAVGDIFVKTSYISNGVKRNATALTNPGRQTGKRYPRHVAALSAGGAAAYRRTAKCSLTTAA